MYFAFTYIVKKKQQHSFVFRSSVLFILFLTLLDIRDRPFNLKGGGGGYGFLFRSEFFFRTTRELEYVFFLSRKARNVFQNLTLGYITQTLNQIIFFSSTKIRIFFQQHW